MVTYMKGIVSSVGGRCQAWNISIADYSVRCLLVYLVLVYCTYRGDIYEPTRFTTPMYDGTRYQVPGIALHLRNVIRISDQQRRKSGKQEVSRPVARMKSPARKTPNLARAPPRGRIPAINPTGVYGNIESVRTVPTIIS